MDCQKIPMEDKSDLRSDEGQIFRRARTERYVFRAQLVHVLVSISLMKYSPSLSKILFVLSTVAFQSARSPRSPKSTHSKKEISYRRRILQEALDCIIFMEAWNMDFPNIDKQSIFETTHFLPTV